jgi:DAK2 domain fusion protein YloV
MAEHALTISKRSIDIEPFILSVIDAGEQILQQTPEMLPVLKKAGVIDAGGRGLIIVFTGMYNVIAGTENPEVMEFDDSAKEPGAGGDKNEYQQMFHGDLNSLEDIEFAYCTEFFIINLFKKTTEADIDRFREKLMTIGDCVLVIGDLELVKVHVHTNSPGNALQLALELGELDKLKIENMLEQNRALIRANQIELKPMGMVSVCVGEGLVNIFKDLMVDKVIEGGQTMNPSADDIARAADSVAATDVFIFPNNKNIILAAEQAKQISKRKIHIIPTVNIPQGIAAALNFNPEAAIEENVDNMNASLGSIRTGQVTYAVRNTHIDNFDLKEGDIIGMDNKKIISKGEHANDVASDLIDKMMNNDVSNITLYFGSDVNEEEAEKIAAELSTKYTRCDVDIHFGGQPLYYYIISLE